MPLTALAAPFSSPIFAAADTAGGLDASNPTVFMGLLIAAIGALALTADRIDGMIQRRRRRPSVDVDLVALSAAITTLTQSVEELKEAKENHNGHQERIASLEERCRGLEAELKREIAAQRSYVAKTSREIFDRIEGVEKSVSKNFQDVERGLGRVEGSLTQIAQAAQAAQQLAQLTAAKNP